MKSPTTGLSGASVGGVFYFSGSVVYSLQCLVHWWFLLALRPVLQAPCPVTPPQLSLRRSLSSTQSILILGPVALLGQRSASLTKHEFRVDLP